MKWLRLGWRALILAGHVLLGMFLTAIFARRERATASYRYNPYVVTWWHGRLLKLLHVEVEASGPRPQPGSLLVSNHISWLDIPVLGSLAPTSFLSKQEVRHWPVIGWLAAGAGTLFIRRGSGEASAITRAIAERLEDEGLLTLFPEGTTTDGSDVRPFFSRLFGAAIETGSPVVPVALRYHVDGERDRLAPYIDDQSLLDNLTGILQRHRTQVRVAFGAPIDMRGMSRKTAAERARSAVRTELDIGARQTDEPPREVVRLDSA